MGNWEELPQEILELIACRLAVKDYLAFGGVCTSWRSAATKEKYKAMLEAPWRKTHARKQIAEFSIPSGGTIFQLRASRVATMSPRDGYSCQRGTATVSSIRFWATASNSPPCRSFAAGHLSMRWTLIG
ncbi:hypothetical protein NL676_008699 [Syzygium grande]|nr:hypothetical protein NL676_008699 [Syzygium grande]